MHYCAARKLVLFQIRNHNDIRLTYTDRVTRMETLAVLAALTMAMEADLEAQLGRFPPRDVTDAWVEFNWNHLGWLKAYYKQSWGEARLDYLRWWIDVIERRRPWKLLQDAQNRASSISSRKVSLYKLSDALGAVAFFKGQMPLAVPLSRFHEGKPPPSVALLPAQPD